MRTALLPAGPDPYLLRYWLRNYATWADSVDELHITVCGQTDPTAKAYIHEQVHAVPNASVTFINARTHHGIVIDSLVRGVSGGLVLLCEDDAFVQDPAVIEDCFGQIEDGAVDLVATPRMYGSYALFDRADELWGVRDAAFSPAFLFARLSDLGRVVPDGTVRNRYGSTGWEKGARIESLDMEAEEDMIADTFVAASFQLRAMGLRIEMRQAFRASEASPDGPWFHVGSLSDGYGCAFLGPDDLHRRMVDAASADPADWYKRVAWWRRVWSKAEDSEHHRRYGDELQAFVNEVGLDGRRLDEMARDIETLVTWPE